MAEIIDLKTKIQEKQVQQEVAQVPDPIEILHTEDGRFDFAEDMVGDLADVLDAIGLDFRADENTKKDFYMVYVGMISLISRSTGEHDVYNRASEVMFESFFGDKPIEEFEFFDIFS